MEIDDQLQSTFLLPISLISSAGIATRIKRNIVVFAEAASILLAYFRKHCDNPSRTAASHPQRTLSADVLPELH
jgi:hypothetical protein